MNSVCFQVKNKWASFLSKMAVALLGTEKLGGAVFNHRFLGCGSCASETSVCIDVNR